MHAKLNSLLGRLYDADGADVLATRIEARLATLDQDAQDLPAGSAAWSPSDAVLITYADAFSGDGASPLSILKTVLLKWFPDLFAQIHLLPFYPYTSDDGFSVSDYYSVDPMNGTWEDIEALSGIADLVFDYVINHGSSAHPRFSEFLEDRAPGNAYFATADDGTDVSMVTRPRATPLLQVYETARGPRHVWCTFSRDQVDWDFSNPDVLYEFVDIFITYIERGARWLRMDAIAYLWKTLGTTCVHLPQTHTVVKLLRAIAEHISPSIKLLTETNVPLDENLSYFGEGDQAHIVYNFSLPPILTHALLTGDSRTLSRWCQGLPRLQPGCTFLNFTASHDGIGLRPAEGILTDEQLEELVNCVDAFGGHLTQRSRPDGSVSPYEANISLFDAFKGTVRGEDEWQVERFLASQCTMLSLAGVPAVYYNSLIAAPNNVAGVEETGRYRTINRKKWTLSELDTRLSNPDEAPRRVLDGMSTLLHTRRNQSAFHPEAPQECLMLDARLFSLVRTAIDQRQTLLCLCNLSAEVVELEWARLPLQTSGVHVAYTQESVHLGSEYITLSPYAALWLDITP